MKKTKWLVRTVAVTMCSFALTITMAITAWAFDEYYVSKDNSFSFVLSQKKASSSATTKYGTGAWYFFPTQTKAADSSISLSGAALNEAYYIANSMPSTTAVKDRIDEDDTYKYDEFTFSAEDVMSAMKKWHASGTINRSQLNKGITLYASRSLKIIKNGTTIGTVYSYPEMVQFAKDNDIKWSGKALATFKQSYDIPIHVTFQSVNFTIKVVDENRNQAKGLQEKLPANFPATDYEGIIYYGEKISGNDLPYPGEMDGYTYSGYEIKAGNTVIASSTEKNVTFTANQSDINNENVVLEFIYTKDPEPTMPPFVDDPEEEEDPPAPPPTDPPAPPIPPQPSVSAYNVQSNIRKYSTDAGFWLGQFAGSTSDYAANYGALTGLGTLNSLTNRTKTYLIGSDGNGNTWYFIASGSNATYVHPCKYNGYMAESADVKYITELTFPSAITYNGTTYTVIHIGGGTDKYAATDSTSNGAGAVYTSTLYRTTYGENYHTYGLQDNSSNTYVSRYHYAKVKYGVLGNGAITSEGNNATSYLSTGAVISNSFTNSYYFYNTTLKSITIPSTVSTIEEYAFKYCQALENIYGGDGITSINRSAFLVDGAPVINISQQWVNSGNQSFENYYYNGECSYTSPTSVMSAWQKSSMLSAVMKFPYLKKLRTLGHMSFAYHKNISEVDLSSTVTTIEKEAFLECALDNIRIPNASCSIYDESGSSKYYTTLGTKGLVETPTNIHCPLNSTAMTYGLKYDGYYKLFSGNSVTYYPNGGTPTTPVEVYSSLNISYLKNPKLVTYANYKQDSDSNYFFPNSSDCQYASYLDEDGVLYRIDLLNNRVNVVSAGTTFTELIPVSSSSVSGVAHYAWDSSGNLWFSGQYSWRAVDSSDEWYSKYSSSLYDWRKVGLPANTVDVQLDERGVFALDRSGNAWFVNVGSNSSRKITETLFKKFYVSSYNGDTEDGEDSMLVGITTAGKVVYSSWGFDLDSTLSSDYLFENSTMTNKVASYNIKKIEMCSPISPSLGYMFFTDTGDLILWRGSYDTSISTLTGYNITKMEYLLTYADYGSYSCYLIRTASGTNYLGIVYGTSGTYCFMHELGNGVEIQDAWEVSMLYGDGWATDDYSATERYVGIALWTSDGYLTRYIPSSYADGAVRYANVKFKKVIYTNSTVYGIAEDGTLWSGGDNKYGQLGLTDSYDYEYPNKYDALWLSSTGSRTYTDVYTNSIYWVIALGTDGQVYYAGHKPIVDYNGSYTNADKYQFTALGSEYIWPAEAGEKNYIKGYDNTTEISANMFKAPSTSHKYKNWNTAAAGTGTTLKPGDKIELTASLSLYAQWETVTPPNNVIIYQSNGGYGTMPNTVLSHNVTSTTLSLNKFNNDGFKFSYWCRTMKECPGYGTSGHTHYLDGATITGVTGTVTLYAQWEAEAYIQPSFSYTLIYMKYPYGTSENVAWKTKTLSYATVETVEGQPYTPAGYTVTYNLNKPASMSSVPTALSKTTDSTVASSFNNWRLYKKNTSGEYVYFGNQYAAGATISKLTQQNGDIVYLYPTWNPIGSSVLLPYTEATGYIFEGWSESIDGSSSIFPVYPPEDEENVGTYTPSKNVTLYGIWTPMQYEIKLDGQNATTHTQTTVTATYDAAMPTVTIPARTQYVFKGYYTEKDGSGTQYYKEDGTSARTWNMTQNTTLYAYWVPDRSVEFNANGGSGTMATIWLDSSASSTVLTKNTFTKTGYSFSYWCQTTAACTGQNASGHKHWSDGATITGVTTRVILYAQWSANPYTVTLSQPNATTQGTTSVTATYDAAMPTVTIPKRSYKVTFDANNGTCATDSLTSNYLFGGYYTGTNGSGTQYYKADGTSARTWNIAQDTTLHEMWTSVAVTLPTPTKTGYTFLGWYTAASGGTKIGDAGDAYTPTADITLYAQWEANDYTVAFDWNFNWDEIGIDTNTNWTGDTKTVTYDSPYGTLPAPTREGYEFEGWYTGEDAEGNGDGTQIFETTIVKTPNDHTLHAKWSIRYMESADIWLKTLRKEVSAVAIGTPNQLQMLEFGDTLLNLTVTTDGFFDYMKISAPWRAPITVDFDDGTFDKAKKIWYLPSEDYIQFFAAGGDPTAIRNNPGYTNQNQLITVDFYKKDGSILITYNVNVIFIPYDVWKHDVVIGREPTS